jgi:hypothetical protein
MPVAREQANALAFTLNNQVVAVMLDFVDPFRPVRNLGALTVATPPLL